MNYTFLIILGVKNVDSIRFSVPAKRGGKLLDYSKTVVALNIRCTNKDGDDIPPPDCGAAPAQNFTSSIFSCLLYTSDAADE